MALYPGDQGTSPSNISSRETQQAPYSLCITDRVYHAIRNDRALRTKPHAVTTVFQER